MNNLSSTETPVAPNQLSNDDWITLAWGFWWRSLFVSIGALGLCAIVLFLIAFIAVLAGKSIENNPIQLQIIGLILGLIAGFFSFFIYIRWLLNSRYGEFRIQLFRSIDLKGELSNT